jgi:hypothetical protein
MDIGRFLEKDKNDNAKKPMGNKIKSGYLTLTDKKSLGHTFICKPLLDTNELPFRRIKNPTELHIQVPNQQGEMKWKMYGILGNKLDYGRLTNAENDAYDKAVELINEVGNWGDPSAWLSTRKVKIIFYAYALKLIDKQGTDKLESKGLTLCTTTSASFADAFYSQNEQKTKVFGSGAWINDYFSCDHPERNMVVTTAKAEKSFGFTTTLDFLERPPEVTVDELKAAVEQLGDLNNVTVKASFDIQYFQEIIQVCENWLKDRKNLRTTQPVETPTDKIQTEVAATNGPTGTPVTPIGESTNPPPPPNVQMKV